MFYTILLFQFSVRETKDTLYQAGWSSRFEGQALWPPLPSPTPKPEGPGTGDCETCTPEAEVHEQGHRVLQCVVRQAIGVLQNINQPEDEAVSNHRCLQWAPRM